MTIEVTSVNNRYLGSLVAIAQGLLSEYENEVREAIGKLVSRGKLSMTIVIDDNSITPQMLKLNEDVAQLYYKMFRDLKTKFKLVGGYHDLSLHRSAGFVYVLLCRGCHFARRCQQADRRG